MASEHSANPGRQWTAMEKSRDLLNLLRALEFNSQFAVFKGVNMRRLKLEVKVARLYEKSIFIKPEPI